MSDMQPVTYKIRIELLNGDEIVIGDVELTGVNGAPGIGQLVAGGVCNYGPATPEEVAKFLIALAGDLRGSAHPERLDS